MKRSVAEVEVSGALNILLSASDSVKDLERWWPVSKRGSNAQRALDALKEKIQTARLCCDDALAAMEDK